MHGPRTEELMCRGKGSRFYAGEKRKLFCREKKARKMREDKEEENITKGTKN